jgi:hypothetical protein
MAAAKRRQKFLPKGIEAVGRQTRKDIRVRVIENIGYYPFRTVHIGTEYTTRRTKGKIRNVRKGWAQEKR